MLVFKQSLTLSKARCSIEQHNVLLFFIELLCFYSLEAVELDSFLELIFDCPEPSSLFVIGQSAHKLVHEAGLQGQFVSNHGQISLTGRNQVRVFNSRPGHTCIYRAIAFIPRRPNLKLKTRPKQLLGYLPH